MVYNMDCSRDAVARTIGNRSNYLHSRSVAKCIMAVLWLLPKLTFATKKSEQGLTSNLINRKCHSSNYDPRCESSRVQCYRGWKRVTLKTFFLLGCPRKRRFENIVCCNSWSTQRTFIIWLSPSITSSLIGPQDDHHRNLERFSTLQKKKKKKWCN